MTGDGQVLPVGEQEEAVPVQVAAHRLGKSCDAVRSALRRGKLHGRKGNDGDWLVYLPPIPACLTPEEAPGFGPGPELADLLRQELERTRAELQQAREAAETWRQQAENGRVAVAEAQAKAAALQQALERERELLALERARTDWLETALHRLHEEARRPWWRRLLG
jgi:hypothetical protein